MLQSSFTGNVKTIYHLADIHIRTKERHDEYRHVFNNLYTIIDNNINTNSIAVICGDIFHSKVEALKPACISLTIEFIKNIAQRMDVIVIMGNHDGNSLNKDEMDNLTPLLREIKATHHIHYLYESDIYYYNNIAFGVSSIYKDKFITAQEIKKKKKTDIKIALYHGPVHNSIVDVGYRMNNEELTVDSWNGYDYVLLGDIHKHQYLNEEKTIAYPSSLIQQNYGETINNHGFIKWNLDAKTSEFIEVPNDYGFVCITVKNNIVPELTNMPKKPRIKIIHENTSSVTIHELVTYLESNYEVQSIAYPTNSSIIKKHDTTEEQLHHNLQDIEYQNTLMRTFMAKNMGLTVEQENQIININTELNKTIEQTELPPTNKWKIKNLDFNNMFCYGSNNELDFNNLDGIIGLFAPNNSGKSSIVDIIMFTLFDKCSRGLRTDVLNLNKTSFHCRMTIDVNGTEYVIMRSGKFPKKNAKNIKIDAHLWKINQESVSDDDQYLLLNGVDRNDTNKLISDLIGTYDDYIMTTFCLQKEINFIDISQSKKKEFLMRMMKLNIFDLLLDQAKIESKTKTVRLKEYQTQIKNTDPRELRAKLIDIENRKIDSESKIEKILLLTDKYKQLNPTILETPKINTDLSHDEILEQIESLKKKINIFNKKIKTISDSDFQKELNDLLSNPLGDKEQMIIKHKKWKQDRDTKLNNIDKEIKELYSKLVTLPKFEKSLNDYTKLITDLRKKLDNIDTTLSTLTIEDIVDAVSDEEWEEQQVIVNNKKSLENKRTIWDNKLKVVNTEITVMKSKLDKLNKHKYNPNCEYCINNVFVTDAKETKKLYDTKIEEKVKYEKQISIIDTKLETIDLAVYNELIIQKEKYEKYIKLSQEINHKKELLNKDRQIITEKINKIDDIIIQINDQKDIINENKKNNDIINKLEKEKKELINKKDEEYDNFMLKQNRIDELNKLTVDNRINKVEYENKILKFESEVKELEIFEKEIVQYDKIMEQNESVEREKKKITDMINRNNVELKKVTNEKESFVEQIWTIKKELESYDKKKKEIIELENDISGYNSYIKIVCKDGLPYSLLNDLIIQIQTNANNLLISLTKFSIEINRDSDGIYVHKIFGNTKLGVDMCCGFEKFIIGLAIRLTLINLSKLSNCNFMFVDEAFTALDESNRNNLTLVFNMLRDMFDFVIVTSHLDYVKSDCNDYISISVDKKGYSRIKV